MRLSSALLGGLLWKPIRPNPRIRARRRRDAARVARIESFLRNYPLNRWGSTKYVQNLRRKERIKQGLPLYEFGPIKLTK